MRISMASIFHQPILSMHIMSNQNSVFIAFIDQHTNPAKVKSIPVSERLPLQQHRTEQDLLFFLIAGLYNNWNSYFQLLRRHSPYIQLKIKHIIYWMKNPKHLWKHTTTSQNREGKHFAVGTWLCIPSPIKSMEKFKSFSITKHGTWVLHTQLSNNLLHKHIYITYQQVSSCCSQSASPITFVNDQTLCVTGPLRSPAQPHTYFHIFS